MTIDIELDVHNHIENYETLLNKYSSYKGAKRQIKLNTILDKDSVLSIEDIKPAILIDGTNSPIKIHDEWWLKCNSIEMKIDRYMYITHIKLKICQVNKKYELTDPKIEPYYMNHGIEKLPQVLGFYVVVNRE